VLKAVDAPIEALRKSAGQMTAAVEQAEGELKRAADEAAPAARSLRESQQRVNGIAGRMQGGSAEIDRLRGKAGEALAANQHESAIVVAEEIRKLAAELSALAGEAASKEALGGVLQSWRRSRKADQERAGRAEGLDKARRDLAAAQQELQAKLRDRDSAIREGLAGKTPSYPAVAKTSRRAKPRSRA
jgi:chromosome segregation ATPase